jgi:hypothetical protein
MDLAGHCLSGKKARSRKSLLQALPSCKKDFRGLPELSELTFNHKGGKSTKKKIRSFRFFLTPIGSQSPAGFGTKPDRGAFLRFLKAGARSKTLPLLS